LKYYGHDQQLEERVARIVEARGMENDAATMSAMMSHGIDGVITDKPAPAKSVLAERAQLGPFVRLRLSLPGSSD
jgi:hypothetical protein